MADAAVWLTYNNVLSVYDPPGIGIGQTSPSMFSSNGTVTIPTLNTSNLVCSTSATTTNLTNIGNASVSAALTTGSLNNTSTLTSGGLLSANGGIVCSGNMTVSGTNSMITAPSMTSTGDVMANGKLRVATTWVNPSSATFNNPSTYTNAEGDSNAIVCSDGRSNNGQFLYMGADSINGVSYISATGNTTLKPLLLQPRNSGAGGVGIGKIPAAGLVLDVAGAMKVGGQTTMGNLTADYILVGGAITTNDTLYATGVVVNGNAQVNGTLSGPTITSLTSQINALSTAVANPPIANGQNNPFTRIDLLLNVTKITSTTTIYPLRTGYLTSLGLPPAITAGGAFIWDTRLGLSCTNGRLNITGAMDTATMLSFVMNTFNIKYTGNYTNPGAAVWYDLLTPSGQPAKLTLNVRGVDYGSATTVSDWFKYPSSLVGTTYPIWIGLQWATNDASLTPFVMHNCFLEVY